MIIVFVELPIGIATTLAIPIHAAFSDDEIRIGHFGSLRAAKHPYSDLKRVFQADGYRLRDGSFKYCPAVILHFSDGTNWSSANNSDCKPLDEGIVSFVEGRAHTQSLHIEVLPRSALLGDSTIDLDKVDSTHRWLLVESPAIVELRAVSCQHRVPAAPQTPNTCGARNTQVVWSCDSTLSMYSGEKLFFIETSLGAATSAPFFFER
jgi:hypothetical protein